MKQTKKTNNESGDNIKEWDIEYDIEGNGESIKDKFVSAGL